ncbi:MAG: hypothetical protein MIO93_11425, partial [ANME-2 cluster archaeon]|nr:hypothetical protein [ANME-2 cluster archaeon]
RSMMVRWSDYGRCRMMSGRCALCLWGGCKFRIQKTLSEIVISHHENITGIRAVGDINGFTGNHG